jgi:hypothetical protein
VVVKLSWSIASLTRGFSGLSSDTPRSDQAATKRSYQDGKRSLFGVTFAIKLYALQVAHSGGYRLSSDAPHELQSVTEKRWSLMPRSLNRARALAMSSCLVARPDRGSCLRGREGGSRYPRPGDKDARMPELLIDFITSLDGCAAAGGWPGWLGARRTRVPRVAGRAARSGRHGPDGCSHVPPHAGIRRRGRARHRCPGGHVEGRLPGPRWASPFPGRTRNSWPKTPLRPCGR